MHVQVWETLLCSSYYWLNIRTFSFIGRGYYVVNGTRAWELIMEFKYICLVTLIKSTLGLIIFLCKMKGRSNIYILHFTKTLTNGMASGQVPPIQCWMLRLHSPMRSRLLRPALWGLSVRSTRETNKLTIKAQAQVVPDANTLWSPNSI